MKDILKPAISLFIITLTAAVCLGVVYGVTKEPIAREKAKTEARAMREVLPGTDDFKADIEIPDDAEGVISIFAGYRKDDPNTPAGYVIGVATKGYGGRMEMYVGVDMSGAVQGISILEHDETAGLGANADSDWFKGRFVGKSGTLKVTKSTTPSDDEIEAITSATITTRAVTKGVNDALACFRIISEKG